MFSKMATARSVAEDGYQGMIDGKLDVVSGLKPTQQFMIKMIPFMPKNTVLKQVRGMQEI